MSKNKLVVTDMYLLVNAFSFVAKPKEELDVLVNNFKIS